MISFPIGIFFVFVVFAVSMGSEDLPLYFNLHSAVLVGGGTLALFFFTTPMNVIQSLSHQVSLLVKKSENFDDVKASLIQLAQNKNETVNTKEELILYAQDLWRQGTEHELFIILISQKRKDLEQKSVDAIQSLKNLAKYPPSLGMAGTVMGIVTLFRTLEKGKDQIGPALAMALTATFFGLMIANGIVMPLADRLQIRHLSYTHYLSHVYQVLLLINQEESEVLIEEEVELRASA